MSPVAHDNSNTAAVWGPVTVETRTKIELGQSRCQIGTKTGRRKQPWYIACYDKRISSLHSASDVIPKQEGWIYGKCLCNVFLCVSDRSQCNTERKTILNNEGSTQGVLPDRSPPNIRKRKCKTPRFCRHDGMKSSKWYALQPKSAEIDRWLVH